MTYVNPIQDGPFWGCLRMGGGGGQKGVAYILQL